MITPTPTPAHVPTPTPSLPPPVSPPANVPEYTVLVTSEMAASHQSATFQYYSYGTLQGVCPSCNIGTFYGDASAAYDLIFEHTISADVYTININIGMCYSSSSYSSRYFNFYKNGNLAETVYYSTVGESSCNVVAGVTNWQLSVSPGDVITCDVEGYSPWATYATELIEYAGHPPAPTPTPQPPCDEHWDNVKLLIKSDDVNGSSSFTDSSWNHTVSAQSNAQHSTAEAKFGSSSMHFDGTGDYLLVDGGPDWDFGSDDFTVEFWFLSGGGMLGSGTANTHAQIFSLIHPTAAGPYTAFSSMLIGPSAQVGHEGRLAIHMSSTGTSWDIAAGAAIPGGQTYSLPGDMGVFSETEWIHFAVTRSGTTFRTFAGGVLVDTWENGSSLQYVDNFVIGAWEYPTSGTFHSEGYLNGYLEEIRITKGVARYTSNFTPTEHSDQACSSVPATPTSAAATPASTPAPATTPTPIYAYTLTHTIAYTPTCTKEETEIGIEIDAKACDTIIYVTHPIPQGFIVGDPITIDPGTPNQEVVTLEHIYIDAPPHTPAICSTPLGGSLVSSHAPSLSCDPNWSDVVLLIQSDTTDGSTSFVDSTGNFSVSHSGDAKHSTAQAKFGSSSIFEDGNTDELIITTSDTSLGGSDAHTFECWFRTSSTDLQYLVSRNSNQFYAGLSFTPSIDQLTWGGNAPGTDLVASNVTIDLNTWHHVAAVVYGDGNASIFFNGVEVATTSSWVEWNPYATPSDNISFGAQHYTNSLHRYTLDGYMEEIRWSEIARYPLGSDFGSELQTEMFGTMGCPPAATPTPVTPTPSSTSSLSCDPNWSDVVLLIHGDDTIGLVDSSSFAHPVSHIGDSSTFYPTGNYGVGGNNPLYFNHSGGSIHLGGPNPPVGLDFLRVPDDPAFALGDQNPYELGSGDFTAELRVATDNHLPPTLSTLLLGHIGPANSNSPTLLRGWVISLNTNGTVAATRTTHYTGTTYVQLTSTTTISSNVAAEMTHVVFQKTGDLWQLFINGVEEDSVTWALAGPSHGSSGTAALDAIYIGGYGDGYPVETVPYPGTSDIDEGFTGYMDEIRISRVARYTEDFDGHLQTEMFGASCLPSLPTHTPTCGYSDYSGAFLIDPPLTKGHSVGTRIIGGCCDSCEEYKGFQYGKSFPENVTHALACGGVELPNQMGATGPVGPAGPIGPEGPAGAGVPEATIDDTLIGNGHDSYVSPYVWYHASNRYRALVETVSLTNESYTPDTRDYNVFDITINGTCTLAVPDNFLTGRTVSFLVKQGEGGQHELIIANDYKFDGGYDKLTLTDGGVDAIVCTNVNGFIWCTMANDIKR